MKMEKLILVEVLIVEFIVTVRIFPNEFCSKFFKVGFGFEMKLGRIKK